MQMLWLKRLPCGSKLKLEGNVSVWISLYVWRKSHLGSTGDVFCSGVTLNFYK